tara:strand:- start:177 stop:842 length:666 start_codon:yes stop_codon:yes gene_type:complete
MGLHLLLDSADKEDWDNWSSYGIFQGITTNPSLIKRTLKHCNIDSLKLLARNAEKIGYKEIHLQAWGKTSAELVNCSIAISKLSTDKLRVYVKLPITNIGTKAAKEIISFSIPVTFTACYEIDQVLIAASLGVNYIAPYLGRMNDNGEDGLAKILKMKSTLKGLKSSTQLLIASIRSKNQILDMAGKGIRTFTISNEIAKELFKSEQTINAAEEFEKDSQM